MSQGKGVEQKVFSVMPDAQPKNINVQFTEREKKRVEQWQSKRTKNCADFA